MTGKRPLIALCGYKGVGKTTIADAMISDLHFRRVKMAGGLKSVCGALGLTDQELDGPAKELPSWTVRRLREYGPDQSTAFTAVDAIGVPAAELGWYRYRLARSLNEACQQIPGDRPRDALEHLGTAWGRDIVGPNVWLLSWAHAVDNISEPVVVDDLNFPSPNEESWVRNRGGYVVRVDAPWCTEPVHPTDFEVDKIVPNARVENEEGRPAIELAMDVLNAIAQANRQTAA